MRRARIVAIVLPLILIGGVIFTARRAVAKAVPNQAPQSGDAIEAPSSWVPFAASFRGGVPGAEKVFGRVYRSSNGSDRVESGPTADDLRMVYIRNTQRNVYYARRGWEKPGGTVYWEQGPMQLDESGWQPVQMRTAPDRVVLAQRLEGRQVVQVNAGSGEVHLVAPALNFYPVLKTRLLTGEQWRTLDIQVGEQAGNLFEPPAGSEIRVTNRPGGITMGSTTQARSEGALPVR
jgi:hypothetical protein